MIGDTFEALYRERAQTGRMLVLHLHPWLTGQPFRIGFLDAALRRIVVRQGLWAATVGGVEYGMPGRALGGGLGPAPAKSSGSGMRSLSGEMSMMRMTLPHR